MTPATQAALSRLSYAQHRREPAPKLPIATGTLVRQRSTGFFWYIVGTVGGKRPGDDLIYMLAKHPEGSWHSLADSTDVEVADVPETRTT